MATAAAISREAALAKGELWQRCGWRFKRVTCLVAPDLDSVWCLWGESLRLPLACIRDISIAKLDAQEFRIETFVDGTHVFRVPTGRPGALHYWVATLQGLCAQATEPGFSAQWASVWMATLVQARFRGLLGRKKAAREEAERNQSPAPVEFPVFKAAADDKAAREAARELLLAHRHVAADQLAAVRRGVLARRRAQVAAPFPSSAALPSSSPPAPAAAPASPVPARALPPQPHHHPHSRARARARARHRCLRR